MIADHTSRRIASSDAELQQRVQSVCNKFSDNVHIVANEPTLACYRLQEHVRKSTPALIERRILLSKNDRLLEGRVFDLEYDLKAVKQIYPAETRLCSVKEMLKNSIFMKQELEKTSRERKLQTAAEKKLKRRSGPFDARSESRSLERSSPIVISADVAGADVADVADVAASCNQNNPTSRIDKVHSGSAKSTLYFRLNSPTK